MGKKCFKLIEQPAAKRHGLRCKMQVWRIFRAEHLVQAFLDAGVVIFKGEIQHLARMHVILPKGNSRRDVITELRHEEGFSDFRRADEQISSGVEQTVDDGGFRGIGRVVEFRHGKRFEISGVQIVCPGFFCYNICGFRAMRLFPSCANSWNRSNRFSVFNHKCSPSCLSESE